VFVLFVFFFRGSMSVHMGHIVRDFWTSQNLYHCLLLQEIQIGLGFTFLVPAHPSSPGQNPESRKTVVVVVVYRG